MRAVTSADRSPGWQCPKCLIVAKTFTFTDGDRLDPPGFDSADQLKRYGASIYVGSCPACHTLIYEIEITVLSEPCHEAEFVPDNCWQYKGDPEIYVASVGSWEWRVQHERSVIFKQSYSFRDGHAIDWLDRHFIGPFFDDDASSRMDVAGCSSGAWRQAEETAVALLPSILAWNWDDTCKS